MMFTRRNTYSGQTIDEYIAAQADAITHEVAEETHLSSIIYDGRNRFGLAGEELADFVRRTTLALLESGAKPIFFAHGPDYDWAVQHQYGEHPNEIVRTMIAEWQASGKDPSHFSDSDLCFIVPNGPNNKFVKL